MAEPKEIPPPAEVADVETVRPHASSLGMKAHVAAGLCYGAPLFAPAALFLEKESVFVRFHALQALCVHAVVVVCGFFAVFVLFAGATVSDAAAYLRWPLTGLLTIGVACFLTFLIFKAANWEAYQLPVVGEFCYARTLARIH